MRRLLPLLFVAVSSCITPNVLDEKQRAVETPPAQVAWRAAAAADLNGLFESTSIEGEAAAALWKLYYHFATDGTFSGAALVIGAEQPQFQTLSGTWKLDENGLDLGNGQVGRAFVAPLQLKLEAEDGVFTFRRVE